jgi:hypothetical protein
MSLSFFLSFPLPLTLAATLFIHRRRLSAPCGHHAGRHRGCCPPCSSRGHHQGGRGHRGAGCHCPSPCPGSLLPPRGGGVEGHRCPSAHAIFVFIGIFPGRGPAARPHHLFDLQRHDHHRTSPLGDRSAQRPSAGEHRS